MFFVIQAYCVDVMQKHKKPVMSLGQFLAGSFFSLFFCELLPNVRDCGQLPHGKQIFSSWMLFQPTFVF